MRKIWRSSNIAPTCSLMSWAEARSRPSGFSRTTRDAGEETLTAHLLPGDADDAAVLMQLAISMAVVQGGQQLAHGEVAGAAKNNHIEWLLHSEPVSSRASGQALQN